EADLAGSVAAAFDRIGADTIIAPGDPVAIKINLGGGIHHVPCTYSDPVICEQIILQVQRLGGKPFVCEADMRGHLMHDGMLEVRGYADMLRRTGTPFVNLSRGKTLRMECRELDIPLELPEVLLRPETKIVSFAPPKHHWECGITASQKNMYGAIAEQRKSIYHRKYERIDRAVAAAARIMTPDLNILAGFDLGAGLGPHFCIPIPFNRMIVAKDMLRGDKAAADILGFPYDRVKYAAINAAGETVDYDLDPASDWPDAATLDAIASNSIDESSVRFWKPALYLQYFVPHLAQITVYPPLEFIATWINHRLFRPPNRGPESPKSSGDRGTGIS
ncbi:MAG: hypothetical protein QG656_253, partial [Candidatus Hydrogenedentes bacterium]|nr:hypothetical protein [Candidatus Hydrogenedentota bacterium]